MIISWLWMATAASAAVPQACVAYRATVDEVSQLGPNIVILRPGAKVKISPQGQELLNVREKLALAIQAATPDLAAIEQLLKTELRLRSAFGSRLAESDLACKMATLRTYDREKLKEALEFMRPQIRAEIEQQRLTVKAPAPPPPMSRPAAPDPR